MSVAFRPASPSMECNTHLPTSTGSLVYPALKLTDTKIDTCAVATRPEFLVLPCSTCKDNADTAREVHRARNNGPVLPTDGAHMPYVPISVNSNKKMKQMGAAVERTLPNPTKHALPGPAPVPRPRPGAHNPYVPACHDGICTGQCFEGICNGGAPWDGKCIEQDICKMLGPNHCICYLTEAVPKYMVTCLDWVNCGKCDPSKRGLEKCPYAHPDLTKVHPDVCCNYLLTGICRFHRTEAAVSADGQKKKKSNRNRGPSDCMGCHCAVPKNGVFPLLPGLTKKILRPLRTEGQGQEKKVVEWDHSDLDRALAPYKVLLGRQ